MCLAVRNCAHLFEGWAQKLAHSNGTLAQDSYTGSYDVRTHPMRNVFRRLCGILVAWTYFLCVQLYKVLTANFDFAFVLTRSRQVVGQLHLQPRLRRAPEGLG